MESILTSRDVMLDHDDSTDGLEDDP
jgi:hypothetical protein